MSSGPPGPAGPSPNSSTRPRPAVCSTNSMRRSWPAARQALREHQPAAARQRDLDGLAQDPETAWADAERLISTRLPAQYDAAVTLLRDLQEVAQREDQAPAFARRFAALRVSGSQGCGLGQIV